jgi:hypothetical protein
MASSGVDDKKVAKSAKYNAAVMALFPPPKTATIFSLKNGPSQVAQYEIPLPRNCFSLSIFNFLYFSLIFC